MNLVEVCLLPLVITLSSIPSRFRDIRPTLESLLRQELPARDVRLYIPRSYRRFPEWDGVLPDVPAGITICRVDEDFGPATKVLPAIRDHAGEPVELLLCDDDRIYDPRWTTRFAEARVRYPDVVITEDGARVGSHRASQEPGAVRRAKDWRYRMERIMSLGLSRPPKWTCSGFVDTFKGYSGALLRPDFIPGFAFDIPEILWTVDDIWLSGCLATNGVGIWVNANSPMSHERAIAKRDALLRFSYQDHGRQDANRACWEWFQKNKNIWH
jgi:hypothetical protein